MNDRIPSMANAISRRSSPRRNSICPGKGKKKKKNREKKKILPVLELSRTTDFT